MLALLLLLLLVAIALVHGGEWLLRGEGSGGWDQSLRAFKWRDGWSDEVLERCNTQAAELDSMVDLPVGIDEET